MSPMPGRMGANDSLKAKKPENLRDVPRYLREVIFGTLSRLVYIFKLVWEARPSLLLVMLFMTVYNGFMPLVGTLITAHLLEQVVLSFTQEVNLLIPLALQFGFTLLNTVISSLSNIITRISGEVVTNHVKIKIMHKAREVDLASFDMPDFYARLENASREAGSRPVNILHSSFDLISRVISMVSYIVVLSALLSRLDWKADVLFLLFVGLNIATALITFYFRRKNFFYMRFRSKDRRQLEYYSNLMVNKDVVKEIRLFHLADIFIGRYKEIFTGYFKGIKSIIWQEGGWNMFLSLCSAGLNMALFYLIATNVRQIADYSVYTGALNAISGGVSSLIMLTASIYEGSLFIDNMILFMNEKKTIVPATETPLIPQRHCGHTIELRDVSFAYPGTNRMVLKHLNLTLEAGETAVLVGLNGAGKTTLIKLITRLYDPTEGVILLDGKDIRDYDVEALYSLYGIIFQDFGKYAVSAGENIRFGEVERPADMEEIQDAARQASADEFIRALPRGYDTPLMRYFEETGIELSIGQWQKLSVARAFYGDSDILILDEPTASLDAIAEQEIYSQFDKLRQNRTTLFVSHRLSSATTADKIIVLKDGEIIEVGDHKTLMASGGEYSRLFTAQASRYLGNDAESAEPAPGMVPPAGGFPGAFPGGFPGRGRGSFPPGSFPPGGGFPGGAGRPGAFSGDPRHPGNGISSTEKE